MDGTEIEVTDLRTGATHPHALAENARRPRGARRILQGQSRRAFLTLCTALLVFLLLARAGASPDLLGLLFHRPSPLPVARLGIGADTLYFAHGVPWGHLSLDGRTLGDADYSVLHTDLDPPYISLRLTRGPHTLEYRAAPFPVLRCDLSLPASPADTCPLLRPGKDADVTQLPPAQRILDLGATPGRLSPALLASLRAAVGDTLARTSSATTAAAGERILSPDGRVSVAPRPLTATLLFAPGSGTRVSALDANGRLITLPCLGLCASRALLASDDPHAWTLYAQVRPHWWYTDQADARRAYDAPAATPPIAPDGLLRLAVTWDGAGWQVAAPAVAPANPTCDTGISILAHQLPAYLLGNVQQAGNMRLSVLSGPVAAAGCLLSLSDRRANLVASSREALFLYHFGVLFAVAGFATQITDDLPVAAGAVADLALHLAALQI